MRFLLTAISFVLVSAAAFAAPDFSKKIPEGVKTQMLQDFVFIKGLQGRATSATYFKIFETRTLQGEALLSFFAERVKKVDLGDCGGGPQVAACVIPMLDHNKMFLTQNYLTHSMAQVFRASIIFHESRHTEIKNDFWNHDTCPVPYLDEQGRDIVGIISGGKLEGQDACDTLLLGAYGMQASLLKNIENACTNCNEKVLMDAKIFGDDMINRISDLDARKKLKNDLQAK